MPANGWICLHRKIWDNPRAKDPEWLAVWLYLLTHATHKPILGVFQGKVINLIPGQLITGRAAISNKVGVLESKVRRVLETLKTDQQISQQTSNLNSLITIVKWNEYQQISQQISQPPANQRPTNDQQAATNNNKTIEQGTEIIGQNLAVELPHGFPKTSDEAKTQAQFAGVSLDFAVDTWVKAMSRGGRDAKDNPIRIFRYYLMNEWKYEQERIAKNGQKNRPHSREPEEHIELKELQLPLK